MKKVGYCLIIASLVTTGILCGFLWGRNYSLDEAQLAGNVSLAIPESEINTALSDKTNIAPGKKININTATAEELSSLPGIGPALAQRIIEYREQTGPFTCIEALDAVAGIGYKTLEDIQQYITAGGVS